MGNKDATNFDTNPNEDTIDKVEENIDVSIRYITHILKRTTLPKSHSTNV